MSENNDKVAEGIVIVSFMLAVGVFLLLIDRGLSTAAGWMLISFVAFTFIIRQLVRFD